MERAEVETYALSPMQQGLLFHHLLGNRPGVDFEQIVCSLREPLDVPVFEQAWQRVVERHPALRTSFRWEDLAEPVQDVQRSVELPVFEEDWRSKGPAERQRSLDRYLRSDRERGFDLTRAPLLRVAILRTGAAEYEVVWSVHHILLDGRSFPIVLREVFGFYEALRSGTRLELPTPRPYRDHVEWLAQRSDSGAESFWRSRLADFQAPTPLPASRPLTSDEVAGDRGESERLLSETLTQELAAVADRYGVSLNTLVQAAWGLLLARLSGEGEVVFGATRAGRRSSVEGAEDVVGLFINTLPVRVKVATDELVSSWLCKLRDQEREVRPHEQAPLFQVQTWSDVSAGQPLFESLVIFDTYLLDDLLRSQGGDWEQRSFRLLEQTSYPLTLYAYGGDQLRLRIAYDHPRFEGAAVERLLDHLEALFANLATEPDRPVSQLDLLAPAERRTLLDDWNTTECEFPQDACIHHLFEAQVERSPDAIAVVAEGDELSYRELDRRSNRLAHHLRELGVGPDVLVGLCLDRSVHLFMGMLAVLKAGGAYVPLDPAYPSERIRLMLDDSECSVLVTEAHLQALLPDFRGRVVKIDADWDEIARHPEESPASEVRPEHLAYVIYTSGSTGRPKGVMVEHRNVVNFFVGMDASVPHAEPGTWLAVTSLSFDISVLELLWTLARGFKVVLHADERRRPLPELAGSAAAPGAVEFSLMYFASDAGQDQEKYRLLIEGAKFADANGFTAVWTPERHFHAFGGLYPSPSLAGAALSTITQRIGIRAGSVVLPLHHPIRVAEEWAIVDNLSQGRVGVSFASGWQPNDFVLMPQNYADAKGVMLREIETVRRLWRGEAVSFPGPDGEPVEVRTLPRPLQPELPTWVTTAGNEATYRAAGEVGAYVLTHLLGQTVEELGRNIAAYREALRASGYGDERGHVTLMLHSFLGDDVEEVRETVREPMKDYLRTSVGLIRNFAGAWTAFKRRRDGTAHTDVDVSSLSEEELDDLVTYSFERYFETSSLFGTPEGCMKMVEQLVELGVDEIACLIDFGVESDVVLEHLVPLNQLRQLACSRPSVSRAGGDTSLAEEIRQHEVTHLQCTPSMASMILLDDEAGDALGSLRTLLVGGEAFPGSLAARLRDLTSADIVNMYGPTETTIWSSTQRVGEATGTVPIGRPIANTELYVLDRELRPVPVGVTGELYIGGAGVVRGYWRQPELTAERFVPNPFRSEPGARLYHTGDLARYRSDGTLEFLGRIDHQVKVRGHRIELGEIESTLLLHPEVKEAVVVAREDSPGDQRLVAYVISTDVADPSAKKLTGWVRDRLPEPMVPARVVFVDSYPLTPNRKIDRNALRPPDEIGVASEEIYVPPSNEIERKIVAIWQEVLNVPAVGLSDNFFDLGGHSLLALGAHRRLRREVAPGISITDLFRFPTVRALAEHLTAGSDDASLQESQERGEQRRQSLARRRRRRPKRGADSDEPSAV